MAVFRRAEREGVRAPRVMEGETHERRYDQRHCNEPQCAWVGTRVAEVSEECLRERGRVVHSAEAGAARRPPKRAPMRFNILDAARAASRRRESFPCSGSAETRVCSPPHSRSRRNHNSETFSLYPVTQLSAACGGRFPCRAVNAQLRRRYACSGAQVPDPHARQPGPVPHRASCLLLRREREWSMSC